MRTMVAVAVLVVLFGVAVGDNNGRYLTISQGEVCLGQGPRPGDPDCPDTCDATMCISPTDGVVSLMGNWAPGVSAFAQDGYDAFN